MRTRAAYFGIFTALALILGYVELLIPIHFGIPGAKLGLANLITILVLYKMGWKEAFLLSVARVVLGGFIFSNLFSILYSLAGGILSLIVMGILKKTGKFTVVGVSVCGGVFHNVGQLAVRSTTSHVGSPGTSHHFKREVGFANTFGSIHLPSI